MELKLVKVVSDDTYTDKKGYEHKKINYYLVVNGQYIAIRPSFHEGYGKLDLVANVVKHGNKD